HHRHHPRQRDTRWLLVSLASLGIVVLVAGVGYGAWRMVRSPHRTEAILAQPGGSAAPLPTPSAPSPQAQGPTTTVSGAGSAIQFAQVLGPGAILNDPFPPPAAPGDPSSHHPAHEPSVPPTH